jgi:putative hydrolase of the HAD superfamily
MVGDSWTADVLGAQAVGMRAIWLNRHGATCPDPTIVTEIAALEPLDTVADLILQNVPL